MQTRYYTLTEAKSEIEKVLNIQIKSYNTIYFWVKKGFLVPSAKTSHGKKEYPLYSMKDIENFIEMYPYYLERGIIRKSNESKDL